VRGRKLFKLDPKEVFSNQTSKYQNKEYNDPRIGDTNSNDSLENARQKFD